MFFSFFFLHLHFSCNIHILFNFSFITEIMIVVLKFSCNGQYKMKAVKKAIFSQLRTLQPLTLMMQFQVLLSLWSVTS